MLHGALIPSKSKNSFNNANDTIVFCKIKKSLVNYEFSP